MPSDDLCPLPVQGGGLAVRCGAVEMKFRVEQRYVAVLYGAAVAHLDGLKTGQKTGQGSPDRISADGALTCARNENRVMLA
jgi:hypothetical protein